MAMMFCPECGKQISSAATTCPNCGYPVNGGGYAGLKKVIPGRGFGISSMIMGILGVVYGTPLLFAIRGFYGEYVNIFLLVIAFGILAVSFGAASRSRGFNGGQQKAGLTMGIIALAESLLTLIIALD